MTGSILPRTADLQKHKMQGNTCVIIYPNDGDICKGCRRLEEMLTNKGQLLSPERSEGQITNRWVVIILKSQGDNVLV